MKFERIDAAHPLFDASLTLYETSFPPNERRTRDDHLRALQDADFVPLGAVEDGRLLADIFLWKTDGFVYLDSRIKRLIIRHDGFKVFPSMIENVVSQHPAVHQCSVVGCADKEHVQGRLPFVYLVLEQDVPAAKRKQIIKELRQLCIEELPEYVQPVGYKIIPEMPLTLAAKFDYRKLEEEITPRDY